MKKYTKGEVSEELCKLAQEAFDLINDLKEQGYNPTRVNVILRMAVDTIEALIPDSRPEDRLIEFIKTVSLEALKEWKKKEN